MSASSAPDDRWVGDPRLPGPRSTESFLAGYDYRSRFPKCRQYAAGEGGAVYVGDAEGAYAVIADEQSLADLLDVGDTCITIYTFASAEERDRYCSIRYGELRTMQQFNELRLSATMNGKICPMPTRWNELWEMLPDTHRDANGSWVPPLPLILGAWYETTPMQKQARFLEHLEYARDHGVIDRVSAFLGDLLDDEWLWVRDA